MWPAVRTWFTDLGLGKSYGRALRVGENLLFTAARARNLGTHPTNLWTGATESEFRIKHGLAKLLGSAVARSTPPFGPPPLLT